MNSKHGNILYITRDFSYLGGTERFMALLAQYANKKYQVFVYEVDGSGKHANQDVYKQFSLCGIKIIPSPIPGNKFWDPIKSEQIQKIITEKNINIVHTGLFNPDFITLTALIGTEQAIEMLKTIPDYKQLTTLCPELTKSYKQLIELKKRPIWISSKSCSFSVALEETSDEWFERKRITDNQLEAIVSRQTDIIQVVAQDQKSKWSQWNSHVEVFPCCSLSVKDITSIDKMRISKTETSKKINGNKYITVSRLVPHKGMENLVKAFLIHLNSFPNDSLNIVGDGEIKPLLETLAKPAGKHINFLGQLDRAQVFKTLLNSNVGVLLSESEGFPLAVQEMMGCRKPVLVTRVGGIPELVNDKNGLVIKSNDLKATVKGLERFSSMTTKQLTLMGNVSKKKILSSYIQEDVFKKIINSYTL